MKKTSTPVDSAGAVQASADWTALLETMLNAVWLVDAELRIVAVNPAATVLHGAAAHELVGSAVLDFAVTPEDQIFWADAAGGAVDGLESEALVRRADGSVAPVFRRVSRMHTAEGAALFVVALVDRTASVLRERELELAVAALQATLESLDDGVLVTDLRGRLLNFNRRFADLWQLPETMLAQRNDAAVRNWMQRCVVDPARYLQRLGVIDEASALRTSDVLTLRSGRVMERVTLPQCSRGQPIGRVFMFREIGQIDRSQRPPG